MLTKTYDRRTPDDVSGPALAEEQWYAERMAEIRAAERKVAELEAEALETEFISFSRKAGRLMWKSLEAKWRQQRENTC